MCRAKDDSSLAITHNISNQDATLDVGAYPAVSEPVPLSPFTPTETHPFDKKSGGDVVYFSSAPVRNVVSARTYHDHGHDSKGMATTTRGVLLVYADGTRRAVGECRVGVDPSRRCDRPCGLRISPSVVEGETGQSKTCVVDFVREGEEQAGCLPMEGTLKFWFTGRETDAYIG